MKSVVNGLFLLDEKIHRFIDNEKIFFLQIIFFCLCWDRTSFKEFHIVSSNDQKINSQISSINATSKTEEKQVKFKLGLGRDRVSIASLFLDENELIDLRNFAKIQGNFHNDRYWYTNQY